MQRHGIGRQVQRTSSGSTPHEPVTIPQISSSRSPASDRPRQSTLRYPALVSNRPTVHHVRRDPPPIHQPPHRRPTCRGGSIPITNLSRGSQIAIAPAARPSFLKRGFLVWGFFCQGVLLSFVSFFVRSQSPFLRPDPRLADVVARRSCQGWPSRQPCGMLRACQAIP